MDNSSNPAIGELIGFFKYDHLPEKLQAVSKPFCELAHAMSEAQGNEAVAGFRKLLEAKDCFVRALLVKP